MRYSHFLWKRPWDFPGLCCIRAWSGSVFSVEWMGAAFSRFSYFCCRLHQIYGINRELCLFLESLSGVKMGSTLSLSNCNTLCYILKKHNFSAMWIRPTSMIGRSLTITDELRNLKQILWLGNIYWYFQETGIVHTN